MKEKGQSIVELVFAIGIVGLVLSGVVILIINTYGARNKSFERKKAVELAQIVGEDLLEVKKSDVESFWDKDSTFWATRLDTDLSEARYPNYYYRLSHAWDSSCSPQEDCALVTIRVGWSGREDMNVDFYRFFSRR